MWYAAAEVELGFCLAIKSKLIRAMNQIESMATHHLNSAHKLRRDCRWTVAGGGKNLSNAMEKYTRQSGGQHSKLITAN